MKFCFKSLLCSLGWKQLQCILCTTSTKHVLSCQESLFRGLSASPGPTTKISFCPAVGPHDSSIEHSPALSPRFCWSYRSVPASIVSPPLWSTLNPRPSLHSSRVVPLGPKSFILILWAILWTDYSRPLVFEFYQWDWRFKDLIFWWTQSFLPCTFWSQF